MPTTYIWGKRSHTFRWATPAPFLQLTPRMRHLSILSTLLDHSGPLLVLPSVCPFEIYIGSSHRRPCPKPNSTVPLSLLGQKISSVVPVACVDSACGPGPGFCTQSTNLSPLFHFHFWIAPLSKYLVGEVCAGFWPLPTAEHNPSQNDWFRNGWLHKGSLFSPFNIPL